MTAQKKKKLPKILGPAPTGAKRPYAASIPGQDQRDYMQYKPAWRFAELDLEGPFGWSKLAAADVTELLAHFKSRELMTWGEIYVQQRHLNHPVAIEKLCREAQKRLEALGKDDVDELHHIHLTARWRVWGILRKGWMWLLWWDPEHAVCPSALKHT